MKKSYNIPSEETINAAFNASVSTRVLFWDGDPDHTGLWIHRDEQSWYSYDDIEAISHILDGKSLWIERIGGVVDNYCGVPVYKWC